MTSGREVLKRIRRRLDQPCVTCGHPQWKHSLEDPHPCDECLNDVMRERCWAYVRPAQRDGVDDGR